MKSLNEYIVEKFATSASANKAKPVSDNNILTICETIFNSFKDSIDDPTVCDDCYFDTSVDDKELDDRMNKLYDELKQILPQENVCQDNDHTWHIYCGDNKPLAEFMPYNGKIRFMIHDTYGKKFYEKTGIKVK